MNADDALIAEKLFGWKWMSKVSVPVKGTPDYPKHCRVREFLAPDEIENRRTNEYWLDYFAREGEMLEATGDEPLAYSYCSSQPGIRLAPPAYTSDASADYSVLAKVRETWDDVDLFNFGSALAGLWRRLNELPLGCEMRKCGMQHLMYEPGDYSRAALAVLATSKEQG
jgi:hypothetical protein